MAPAWLVYDIQAVQIVNRCTRAACPGLQVGQRYAATVVKLMDYGAFVELGGTGGTQALLHISELDAGRVSAFSDLPRTPWHAHPRTSALLHPLLAFSPPTSSSVGLLRSQQSPVERPQ